MPAARADDPGRKPRGNCHHTKRRTPRGLRVHAGVRVLVVRIIPARAGFTEDCEPARLLLADHPRSRGVYLRFDTHYTSMLGSSPLARGLRPLPVQGARRQGIIPARAGFTLDRTQLTASVPGSSPLARGLPRVRGEGEGAGGIIPARAGFTGQAGECAAAGWDHPRSRGVYTWSGAPVSGPVGSSPLARGLRQDHELHLLGHRIIPARAGFTHRRVPLEFPLGDHPRSRGVYDPGALLAFAEEGSSPLARGLRTRGWRAPAGAGIIPARAGFTPPTPSATPGPTDHPRSRGVYAPDTPSTHSRSGSSPLARGLPGILRPQPDGRRIIPARAGFTGVGFDVASSAGDHPRSRGVYSSRAGPVRVAEGSSPLARGLRRRLVVGESARGIIPARAGFTPEDLCSSLNPCRIIPARAGFTAPRPRLPDAPPDHPRSRGVYALSTQALAARAGSSPLARGLQAAARGTEVHSRIIPARAGFTPAGASSAGSPTDHPRSRGVYQELLAVDGEWGGSSPLARGLRATLPSGRCAPRIIPARAGFTTSTRPAAITGSRIIPARAGFTRVRRRRWPASADHPRSRGVYATLAALAVVLGGSSPLARGLPTV